MKQLVALASLLFLVQVKAQVLPDSYSSYQQAPDKLHYLFDMEVDDQGHAWLFGNANDTMPDPTVGIVVQFNNYGSGPGWFVEFPVYGGWGDLDVDVLGNSYICVSDYDIDSTREDFMTKKLDPDGNVLWSRNYSGPGNNSWDRPYALAVDNDGNVFTTGHSAGTSGLDILTVKYDASGNELWTARYAAPVPVSGTDGGYDAIADDFGNIYVTGQSNDTINGNFILLKYDPDGTLLWDHREGGYYGSIGKEVRLWNDRVVVAGRYTYDQLDSSDVLTAAYDTSGTHLWTTIFNAPPFWIGNVYNGSEHVEDLVVDEQGNCYVAGTEFYGNGFRDDFMVFKLDSNGDLAWNQHYGAGDQWDDASSVMVDQEGSVYVTGNSEDAPEGERVLATVKYDSGGNMMWHSHFSPDLTDHCWRGKIRWDGSEHIYVSGSANGASDELVLLTYGITTSIQVLDNSQAKPYVFPNPATDRLCIRPNRTIRRVEVIDATGRTSSPVSVGAGVRELDVSRLTVGPYLVRCYHADGSITSAPFLKGP